MNLIEQYADSLNNLLIALRNIKDSGQMVDGIPTESLFNFAKSEINALSQGFQTKDECTNCSDCCIAPQIIIPAMGVNGTVAQPLRYVLKHRRQPCHWLRGSTRDGFKCALHTSGEKPFTCYAYQCKSRENLETLISNAEKGITNGGQL